MKSRMERYVETSSVGSRLNKQQSESEKVINIKEYNTVEGIIKVPNKEEVDLEKIKSLILTREEYKKTKIAETVETVEIEQKEILKNYDLKELMEEAKEKRPQVEEKQKFQSINIEELRQKNKERFKQTQLEDEPKLSIMSNDDLVNDMFSDIIKTSQINKNAIKEATRDLDKSFFTKGLNLSKEDFQDDEEIESKKSYVGIIVLCFFIILIMIMSIIYFIHFK
ncbi:MAG: hypothetical protein R3Y21_01650 [Mycoplasmatota bacterium]